VANAARARSKLRHGRFAADHVVDPMELTTKRCVLSRERAFLDGVRGMFWSCPLLSEIAHAPLAPACPCQSVPQQRHSISA